MNLEDKKARIAVGLSGGVDSAVAAMLLRDAGHDVKGVVMLTGLSSDARNLADAAAVAEKLGIPLSSVDVSGAYSREVLGHFRATYLSGRTPNPCVRCNELVKFGLFPRAARELGVEFDFFATGHYARIGFDDGRRYLERAVDRGKDQSYFLHRLDQSTLAAVRFPLGGLFKREVRDIAARAGLAPADRPDSQDFCAGEAVAAIGAEDREGDIVDSKGAVLGRHRGFWHYTIGKRKGLGIGGGVPYYVIGLDPERNRVIVGFAEEARRFSLEVTDMVYGALDPARADEAVHCTVKIRSAGEPRGPATLRGNRCEFPEGLSGIAPGQSAVFYSEDGGKVLAGGVIVR